MLCNILITFYKNINHCVNNLKIIYYFTFEILYLIIIISFIYYNHIIIIIKIRLMMFPRAKIDNPNNFWVVMKN